MVSVITVLWIQLSSLLFQKQVYIGLVKLFSSVFESEGWYIDLIYLLPIIFQLSPFSLGSFCLPSNGAVGGGCWAEGTIFSDRSHCKLQLGVWGAL